MKRDADVTGVDIPCTVCIMEGERSAWRSRERVTGNGGNRPRPVLPS